MIFRAVGAGDVDAEVGVNGSDGVVQKDARPGPFGSLGKAMGIGLAARDAVKLAHPEGRLVTPARDAARLRLPFDHGDRTRIRTGEGFGSGQPGRACANDQEACHCGTAIGTVNRLRVISSSAPRQLKT